MNHRWLMWVVVVVGAGLLGYVWYKNRPSAVEPPKQQWTPGQQPQRSQLEGVFKYARETNKKVVLFFTAANCSPCEQVKKEVFPKPEVQKALGNYVFAQIDANTDPMAVQAFRIKTFPTVVMVDSGMQVQKVQEGPVTADQFIVWLGGTPPAPPKTEPPQKQPDKKLLPKGPLKRPLQRPSNDRPPGD